MSSSPQSDELHLTLNARYEELVRAFARESLLSDAAPTEAASSLAESTLALWRLLCRHAGDERVRLLPFHSGKRCWDAVRASWLFALFGTCGLAWKHHTESRNHVACPWRGWLGSENSRDPCSASLSNL